MRKLVINQKITNRDSFIVKSYLKEVSDIPMFSPEQEFLCAERMSKGCEKSRENLIRSNLRFVVSVAKQYASTGTHLEDLINEGNIGLMNATKDFKPTTGFKFISYAVWYVRKAILEYLTKNSKLVRLPANKVFGISKLNRQIDTLEQQLGRTATIEEILEVVGDEITEEQLKTLEGLSQVGFDSLDCEINSSEGGGVTRGELMADPHQLSADHIVMDESQKYEINKLISTLKLREQRIIIASFGLDGGAQLSLKELAEELGITRETVRQIKNKALVQLHNTMASQLN